MTFQRAELRAFPRLRCGIPARLKVDGLLLDGQVIDVSHGGCKFLPASLAELVAGEFRPGTDMMLLTRSDWHPVVLRWATPNFSAIGCAFDAPDDKGHVPFTALLAGGSPPGLAI